MLTKKHAFKFVLWLAMLSFAGCQTPDKDPRFKSTLIRGSAPNPRVVGNSLEGVTASVKQGFRHVEVDFHISKDNILMTAHDDRTRGCGSVSRKNADDMELCALSTKVHMTRLSKVLSLDFDTVMLDLKTAKKKDFERTVDAAILSIEKANAQDRVIVFVYGRDDRIINKLRLAAIPFGYKGYPKKDTRQAFYEDAAKMKAQYICVKASGVEIGDIGLLRASGITLIGWEDSKASRVAHVRALKKAGMGGLISSKPALF